MLHIVLLIAAAYIACGFVFAAAFLTRGITMIDEGANGSGIGFRLIILPGVIALWPPLLKKWIMKKSLAVHPPEEKQL